MLTRLPRESRLAPSVHWLALFAIAIHLATANRYGIFRDELYYLACARHLAWGYVDHPPLIAFVSWAVAHSLGTSLLALRLLPALAAGALIWLTADLARELGGSPVAHTLAAFAILPVPIYLILDHWLTMNAFEPLLWTGVLCLAARMLRTEDPRYWVWIGLLAGIGIENKYSMLFCVFGLLVGVASSQARRLLLSPWLLLGVVCAGLLALPNLLWLIHHHFPFLEFERNSRASGARIVRGPVAFLGDQILMMNPVLAPFWMGGLAWLLLSRRAARYRALGIAALTVFLLLLVLKAKNYYAAPMYPALFAAGAVALEHRFQRLNAWRRPVFVWARGVYLSSIALSGLVFAPLVMPILSPASFERYQRALGGLTLVRLERITPSVLPQYFADEFGWEAMARATARVYDALPPPERARTAIFANDYGEAGAIDFFGPRYGLPSAISKNESYWLWGPGAASGETVIVLGSDGTGDRKHFQTVVAAGQTNDPYARSDERFTIFLCRHLSPDFSKLWPQIKSW